MPGLGMSAPGGLGWAEADLPSVNRILDTRL